MEKDNASELNDAQKATVADATFIIVKAMAGDEYISDIEGTVAMTFTFENSRGWTNFGAFYVDDNGNKVAMSYAYDADTKQMTVYSTHHSVYAILEVTGGDLKTGILYRSYSPLYDPAKQARSPCVNELAEEAGIQFEIAR